jgi:hypothetical protein
MVRSSSSSYICRRRLFSLRILLCYILTKRYSTRSILYDTSSQRRRTGMLFWSERLRPPPLRRSLRAPAAATAAGARTSYVEEEERKSVDRGNQRRKEEVDDLRAQLGKLLETEIFCRQTAGLLLFGDADTGAVRLGLTGTICRGVQSERASIQAATARTGTESRPSPEGQSTSAACDSRSRCRSLILPNGGVTNQISPGTWISYLLPTKERTGSCVTQWRSDQLHTLTLQLVNNTWNKLSIISHPKVLRCPLTQQIVVYHLP